MVKVKEVDFDEIIQFNSFNHPMVKVKVTAEKEITVKYREFQPPYGES